MAQERNIRQAEVVHAQREVERRRVQLEQAVAEQTIYSTVALLPTSFVRQPLEQLLPVRLGNAWLRDAEAELERTQQRLQAVQRRAAELHTLEKQREKIEQEYQRLENRLAKNTLRAPAAGPVLTGVQSVKTATQGTDIGYDAGKRVKGRKRHLLVDSQGSILQCKVSAAHVSAADGLKALLRDYFAAGVQRLRRGWVDAGYRGEALNAWVANLKQTYKIRLDVSEKPRPGCTLLKRRWVVERTSAWLGNYRIHAKDYEIVTDNSQAFIHIVMIHLLLKRKN